MWIALKRLPLGVKLAGLGVSSIVLVALALIALAIWQSGRYTQLARKEVDGLIDVDLDHITLSVLQMVQIENEAVQQQVDYNLNVAAHLLALKGPLAVSGEKIEWTALDQFTGIATQTVLPKLLMGGQWLEPIHDPRVEVPVVDEACRLIGETATIFQRMNERGDMLRIATTVTNREGRRAIGTYIPAVRADGAPDPVIQAILKGDSYHGRAYVVNARYLTAYQPLYDAGGNLIGMLYVGVRQRHIEARLRRTIIQTKIGKTGYVFVLGGKDEKRGHYIVSQNGERDDENIWESRDSDGQFNVQKIIDTAVTLKPGELATVRYRWQNPGEPNPRWKIARLAYYEPWDWVIGTSVYEDELMAYHAILTEGRWRMVRTMSLVGMAIALSIGWLGVVIGLQTITMPIRQMKDSVEAVIQGRLNQPVRIRSLDEIGALADAFNVMMERLAHTLEGLRRSEEQYRAIFENALEGVFQTTFNGRFVRANSAMAAVLGYASPEELMAEVQDISRQIYLHPEDREKFLETLRKTGRETGSLVQFRRKDGSTIWGTISARVVRDDAGNPLYLEGFFFDLSARIRAEESLREANRQLADIIDFLPDATFIVDADKKIIAWNRAMEDMTGVPKRDMLGKDHSQSAVPFYGNPRPYLMDLLNADDATLAKKYDFIKRKGPALFAETLTPMLHGGRGAYVWAIASPLLDAGGRMIGAIESIRDITDRKHAEDELKKHRDHLEELVKERTAQLVIAKEQAETANQAKSSFLAKMSHELRTPLNAILGYAQIFRRRPLDEDIIKGLDIIQHSGEHLLTLINDILSLSKIEAGKMTLQATTVYFAGFLDGIVDIVRARAEAKGLTFSFEAHGPLPSGVKIDETRMRQVLLNLLDNAVKYTVEGSVVLRAIRREESAADGKRHPSSLTVLRFEVADTGVGIPNDRLHRLFLPFEQVSQSPRWVEGSGLGLAISRQLVQLMGGDLHVSSEPGKGSLFWFEISLPITETAVPRTAVRHSVITGYRGPRRKILIVDDIASNRDVLVDLLRPLGFEIVEAANGHEAIYQAEKERPDLILLDRFMPVMNGFAAALRLREMPALKDCPVIAVSASVMAEDRTQSRSAGFDDFLPKPISWTRLAGMLERYLRIEWEYMEQEPRQPPKRSQTSLQITPPSQEELAILMSMARMGDLAAIEHHANRLKTEHPEYGSFSDRLVILSRGFEEQQILAFLRSFIKEAS